MNFVEPWNVDASRLRQPAPRIALKEACPCPARRGGSTAERVKQPASRPLANAFGVALRRRVEWEADESTTGPASLMLIDPDGNPVLIDQHVDPTAL